MKCPPVTQKSVADAVGINRSCVSRILNGSPWAARYSDSTRKLVLETAKKLGYVSNSPAAVTRRGFDDKTIAFLYSFTGEMSIAFGLIHQFHQAGFSVKLFSYPDLQERLKEILGAKIRYIYIFNNNDKKSRDQIAAFCRRHGLLAVFHYSIQEYPDFPACDGNNIENMRLCVEYLYKLGHRKLALYCGPHTHISTSLRHQGFLDSLQSYGLPADEKKCIACEEFSLETLSRLLKQSRCTGIIAIYPGLGISIYNALILWRLRVPGDLSLMAFGSTSNLIYPRISCMDDHRTKLMLEGAIAYYRLNGKGSASEFSRFPAGSIISKESTEKVPINEF